MTESYVNASDWAFDSIVSSVFFLEFKSVNLNTLIDRCMNLKY